MKEALLFISLFVFWIVLNRWILPWFGVPTCMSGGCSSSRASCAATQQSPADEHVLKSEVK